MMYLVIGKFVALSSPFVLRRVVNIMTSPAVIGAAATASAVKPMTIAGIVASIGLWGLTRIVSTFFLCK
jgi:ABC-type transport system involved in Fe-S cluster assembly fused permease/ATPase subunit